MLAAAIVRMLGCPLKRTTEICRVVTNGKRLGLIVLGFGMYGAIPVSPAYATIDPNATFSFLQGGFTQEVWAVAETYPIGVVFASNGDVLTCYGGGHRFSATNTTPVHGSTIHMETTFASGCNGLGLTNHPNGFVYNNTFGGVTKLDPNNNLALVAGPYGQAGSNYGIATDPQTGNLVYVANDYSIHWVNQDFTSSGVFSTNSLGHGLIDQIAFDPTGNFLFLSGWGDHTLIVLHRDGSVAQVVPMSHQPDGIAFRTDNPQFVATNDTDGTLTRFDFPNNDFTQTPTQTLLGSGAGYGDHTGVGSDGCWYVSNNSVKYADGTPAGTGLVRICPGFAPPPGGHSSTSCSQAGAMETEQPETFDKWSLDWGISKCEGLVLSNVSLGNRLMAERMSLPYMEIQTCLSSSDIFHCQSNVTRHVVLRTNAVEPQTDSAAYTHVQLVSEGVNGVRPKGGNCAKGASKHVCEHISIHATYRVDLAPLGTGGPYLLVTQNDEFYPAFSENKFPELACEPSKEAFPSGLIATPLEDCGRWKPIVKYSFHQGTGSTSPTLLISVKAAARLHFTPDALAVRAGTFFRDCDGSFPDDNCFLGLLETYKPGQEERAASNEAIIRAYQFDGNPLTSTYPGRYDNLHMTPTSEVEPPGIQGAGCPECVHMHWRWGSDIFGPFNGTARTFYGEGQPLIGDGEPAAVPNSDSHQEMDVAMVAYHSETNQLSPYSFSELVQGADLGQLRVGRNSNDNYVGGFTSGSETLEYPSGSCSDSTDLVSWGQCGEVAWLSATSYPYLSRDKSSDTFFAFGGFFCSTCSNGDYREVIAGMAPTYRNGHKNTNAVAPGEVLTIEFSSLRGGVQLNDVLPSGLLNVSASYVPLDGSGTPIGPSTPCPLTTDRLGQQVIECDLSVFADGPFAITISGQVSSTISPGTYYNTVHAVWGAEHSNSRIGGNYKKTDAITILPGHKLGPGF